MVQITVMEKFLKAGKAMPHDIAEALISMTREELAALLEKERARADRAEARARKAEEEAARSGAELRRLREDFSAYGELLRSGLEQANEIAAEFSKRLVPVDEFMARDIGGRIQQALEEWRQWILIARKYYKMTPIGKPGRDVRNPRDKDTGKDADKAGAEKAAAEGEAQAEALRRNRRQQETVSEGIVAGIHRICKAKEKLDKLQEAEKAIVEEKAGGGPRPGKPRKGRQVKDRKPDKAVNSSHAKGEEAKCRLCGADTVPLDEALSEMVVTVPQAGALAGRILGQGHAAFVCRKCGHVTLSVSDEQDIPAFPGREIGARSVAALAEFSCMGMPLNRIAQSIKEEFDIGNDTLYYTLSDCVGHYISPIYDMIEAAAKEAGVIVADGTPFCCMEAQGRRECGTSKAVREGGGTPPMNSRNYILAMVPGPAEKRKFVVYRFLQSRSAENIAKELGDGWRFTALATDAYPGYDRIVSESGRGIVLQNCIVHFRRAVAEALDADGYASELCALDDEKRAEVLAGQFKSRSPRLALQAVLIGISKIYAIEGEACGDGEYDEAEVAEARKGSRRLMDRIGEIMDWLCEKHTVRKKSGALQTVRGDPYSQCCVYWHNNRDKLRAFLDHPELPPDSSCVERAIRPLTLYRNSVSWKAGIRGMEDMCKLYSVWNTCRAQGMSISEIDAWLQGLLRAAALHCLEGQLTAEYRDKGRLVVRGVKRDIGALMADFDFAAWNPMPPEGRARR